MTSALPILHGPDRPELLRGEVLADLFEATAARLPHKTALIAGGEHLSYGALNAAADLAAHRLILAGVRPGDVVLDVNGKLVGNTGQLLNAVAALKPGSDAAIQVLRDGKSTTLHVRIGTRPQNISQNQPAEDSEGVLP